jgi:hypothetical protein
MPAANDVQSSFKAETQQTALTAVLTSRTFSKNPRLAALLKYLCLRYFHGEMDAIKEYNIATDVFGRPADFDQGSDAIVRVEMHRLRKKLKEFYAGEGAQQTLEIVIQSGHYLPEFVVRRKDLEISEAAVSGAVSSRSAETFSRELPKTQRLRLVVWVAIATGIVVAALVAVLISFKRTPVHSAGFENGQLSPVAATPRPPPPSAIPPGEGARLLCGSSKSGYRDRQGNEWGADAFYSGGIAREIAVQPIWRTREPLLFRTMRSGEFAYKIPLKPGIYEMRL